MAATEKLMNALTILKITQKENQKKGATSEKTVVKTT